MKIKNLMPLLALIFVLATFVGCGFLDGIFMPPIDDNGVATGPSVAEKIGEGARALIPGWGTVIGFITGLAGTIYTGIRGQKREKALPALILDVVQAIMSLKGGKLDYNALYASMSGAKVLFSNKDKFVKLVDDVKAALDRELADGFQASDLPRIVDAVEKDFKDITDIPASGANTPAKPE